MELNHIYYYGFGKLHYKWLPLDSKKVILKTSEKRSDWNNPMSDKMLKYWFLTRDFGIYFLGS